MKTITSDEKLLNPAETSLLVGDLLRVPVDTLLAFTILRKPISGRFSEIRQEYGTTGKLNSMYLGRYDADRYLLIYDKTAETKNRQIGGIKMAARPHPASYRPASRTRVELRLKDVGTCADFLALNNPYEHYTIRTYRMASDYRRDAQWIHFLDSCQLRGAQAALSLIENRRTRTLYRDSLRACTPPDWWTPPLLWDEARSAFLQILLPDTNPINARTPG